MLKVLLIASNNSGKVKEFRDMLSPFFLEIVSPKDLGLDIDPDETGTTFLENAFIKCNAFSAASKDCYVLADDSGLEIDALNGAPGVKSARFAGAHGDFEANIDKVLQLMRTEENRAARFIAALVLKSPDNKILTAVGTAEGTILYKRTGNGGFGYDPIFYSFDLCRSFGEATEHEKNAVSHRARAIESLVKQLDKESLS